MDLPELFKKLLLQQKKAPSGLTVKNYLSDLRQFVNWYESTYKTPFKPEYLTSQVFKAFADYPMISFTSKERRLSAIRKFLALLKNTGLEVDIPQNQGAQSQISDPWLKREFKYSLSIQRSSALTIKNYMLDVVQFIDWVDKLNQSDNNYVVSKSGPEMITPQLLEEYKSKLIHIFGFSPRSVNRKLSSIRKYLNFLEQKNIVKISQNISNLIEKERIPLEQLTETIKKTQYSKIPPIRLIQKAIRGIDVVEERAAGAIDAALPQPIEKEVNALPKNLPKEMFDPQHVSTFNLPFHKKLYFHARHTRPLWYKKYHNIPFIHHVHFSLLVVYSVVLALGLYYTVVQGALETSASPLSPDRVLGFNGRLTDTNDNPITTPQTLRFGIYNSETASGSALLWQEVDNVTPDKDGIFSVKLGQNNPISREVLSDNSALFLGISIGSTSELIPRTRLATAPYATNSELLQGMPPITEANAGTNNVILALDSTGDLRIGGNANPTFQATGGDFTLSGQTTVIETNTGSNGDIVLNPDGTGKVDIQSSIYNSVGSGEAGALQITDSTYINATESANAALTVNQNAGGDLFTASLSGSTSFVIKNSGKVGIGTHNPSKLLYLASADTPTITIDDTSNGVKLELSTDNDKAIFGTITDDDIIFQTNATNQGVITSAGRFGIGTTSPSTLLDVAGTFKVSGTTSFGGITYTWPSSQTSGYVLQTDGSGALSWIDSTTIGGWTQSNGSIYTFSTTLDLLVGGTSTSSAKFGLINNASGTPTATISGNITLNSSGVISTTNLQSLNIGGGTTGNITIDPLNSAGTVTITSNLSTNGNTTIGNATSDTITFTARAASILEPETGSAYDFGSSSRRWLTGYFDTVNATSIAGTITGGSSTSSDWLINSDNATADTEDSTLSFERGSPATNSQFKWNSTSKLVSLNVPYYINPDTGITQSGTSALIVNQPRADDIFTASASGTPRFTVSNEGNLTLNGGTTITGTSLTTITGAATAIDFTEFDVAAGTGSITINDGGDAGQVSVEGSVLDIDTLTFVGTGGILSTGDLTIDSTTDINLDADGADILFKDNGTTFATFTNSTTDLTITVAGGNIITSSALNLGGAAAADYNFFAADISGVSTPDGVGDLYIQDELEVDGTIRLNNQTYTFPGTAGSNGYALTTNGSGTLSWTDTSTFGTNYWNQASGSLYPKISTVDLLIGSTATTSAKFGFINVLTGTPTATISAGEAGALSLTSTGTINTTAMQTLTLGSSTTGNVVIDSGTSVITLSDATTVSSNLTVAGTTGLTFTGVGGDITFTNGEKIDNDSDGTVAITATTLSLSGTTLTASSLATFTTAATLSMASTTTLNCGDCIDFDDIADSLSIDAATDINLGTNALTIDLDSSGDFSIRDVTTDIATFADNGAITFAPTSGQNLAVNTAGGGDFIINTSQFFVEGTDGSVGIGTATPLAKFDVNGTASISGNLSFSGARTIAATAMNTLTVGDSSTGNLILSPGGNVGIATTTPTTFKLQVNGDIGPDSAPTITSSSQSLNVVDTTTAADVGEYTSVTIAGDGYPVIAYVDQTNDDLYAAKCGNSTCSTVSSITQLDSTAGSGTSTPYTSITTGTDGFPVIAYYDNATDLVVIKCGDYGCTTGNTTTTVDSTGTTGKMPQIRIGSDGYPVIVYVDVTAVEINVAHCTTASCSSSTITTSIGDFSTSTDAYPSMVIAPDGFPTIVYFDIGAGQIELVKCNSLDCSTTSSEILVTSLADAQYLRMENGMDGYPIIAYLNGGLDDLLITDCNNENCTDDSAVTLDSDLDVDGGDISLAIGTDGYPIVSYFDGVSDDLQVVKCGSEGCAGSNGVTENATIDSATASTGLYSSILIPSDGLPIISYHDSTSGELQLAKCATTSCNQTTGTYYAGGSSLGSFMKFFNNVYAAQFWGKQVSIAHNADLAEKYYVDDKSIEAGDIVKVKQGKTVEKTTSGYSTAMLGVISTNPGITLAGEEGDLPVALAGRVPIKVSSVNGPIMSGDPITSSGIPGVGMKATESGYIVGWALDEYSSSDPDEVGKIDVFIKTGWNNPHIEIAAGGNLNVMSVDQFINSFGIDMYNQSIIEGKASVTGPGYILTDAIGTIMNKAVSYSKLLAANIEAGFISVREISANVISAGKIVSPVIETHTISTDFISPLANDSEIGVSLNNSKLEIKNGKSATNSATVASIDNQGNVYTEGDLISRNASFSGNLTASSASIAGTLNTNHASVSGTLTADKIIANTIEGLEEKVATIAANYIKTNQTSTQNSTQNVPNLSLDLQEEDDFFGSFSSDTGDFIDIASISAQFGIFHEGLVSFGPSTFKDLTAIDNFSIGTQFIFTSNSLDVLGEDLQIQPLKQGGVNFFAGLIKLSTTGDLDVAGNANFAKNVTVKGGLSAGFLSPLPDNDLSINLDKKQNGEDQFFAINDASKMSRLTINSNGDVYSSGSAQFAQNIVASGSALLSKLNLFSQPAYAVSENQEVATSSAGTSILKANRREITITTPFVTENSLIYITPVGDTANQVLYLERQIPGISFTIGVSQSLNRDIQFNWIIIN